jgi:transcriptional regulator with XRE-family HTH domain
MSTPQTSAVVTYSTLVGRLLAQKRDESGMKQSDMANALGMSQSAFSRLESGDSVINIAQLRSICSQLNLRPSAILSLADDYAETLSQQHVTVVTEKKDNSAAVMIGLGLLAALLMQK